MQLWVNFITQASFFYHVINVHRVRYISRVKAYLERLLHISILVSFKFMLYGLEYNKLALT